MVLRTATPYAFVLLHLICNAASVIALSVGALIHGVMRKLTEAAGSRRLHRQAWGMAST